MKFLKIAQSITWSLAPARAYQLRYGNQIFNQIHDSMRQFGSSLHHNGVAAFLATVPEAIDLFHGTSISHRVNGTEWLAFEPEHALMFAHGQRRPPRPWAPASDDTGRSWRYPFSLLNQKPLLVRENIDSHGYLHTYRTKHPLRLLYLDGQSAAKSDKGTLDLQDVVLLNDTRADPKTGAKYGPGDPLGEALRARNLCQLARNEWQGRIDGFLRMEGGFEIILCEFASHVDLIRVVQTKADAETRPRRSRADQFHYLQAVGSRYDGIGGGRVAIDYDDYISLYSYEDVLEPDSFSFPRVNASSSLLPQVRRDIRSMVLREHRSDFFNWQQLTDMVIARYANTIEYLSSELIQDIAQLQAIIESMFHPFIDYSRRDDKVEVARCVDHSMGHQMRRHHTLAARAVLSVTHNICETFIKALKADSVTDGRKSIVDLKQALAWSEWKKCRKCEAHEICFLPIWPWGSIADFVHPHCVSDLAEVGHDYW